MGGTPGPAPATTGTAPRPGTGMVTVRYFAAARAAAGRHEDSIPAPGRLGDLLDTLADRYGERMKAVLAVSSFLVDGLVWHEHGGTLPAESTVDILPPFAGG